MEQRLEQRRRQRAGDLAELMSKAAADHRRTLFLEEQRARRDQYQQLIRNTFAGDPVASKPVRKEREPTGGRNPFVRRLFTVYDVLLEFPDTGLLDSHQWYVRPRPEGTRSLLRVSASDVEIFDKNGETLWRRSFPSDPHIHSVIPHESLFDGVWTKIADAHHIFFIMDILMWHDLDLIGSETSMREFFLKSKQEESLYARPESEDPSLFSLCFVQAQECMKNVVINMARVAANLNNRERPDPKALLGDCYLPKRFWWKLDFLESDTSYLSCLSLSVRFDGLVFIHKESLYSPGVNLLGLHWRPEGASVWGKRDPLLSINEITAKRSTLLWKKGQQLPESFDSVVCHLTLSSVDKKLKKALERKDCLVRLSFRGARFIQSGSLELDNVRINQWRVCSSALYKSKWPWLYPDTLNRILNSSTLISESGPHFVVPANLNSLL